MLGKESPIIIVGSPRSGTTLSAKILGNHSRLFMPGETHFFEDIYANKKELGDPSDERTKEKIAEKLATIYQKYNEPYDQKRIESLFINDDLLRGLKTSWFNYENVLSSFMECQMQAEGKYRWGNNSPRDIFHLDTILRFYPDAKVIVCIRDARDFLISYRDRWKTTTPRNVDRIKRLYHPIVTSLLWKAAARRIVQLRQRKSYKSFYFLNYERLVQNPETVAKELCDFVEEEFEPQMIDINTNNSSIVGKKKGIFASSVGRWRGQLTQEEVYLVQRLAGKEMRTLGYKVEEVKVDWYKLARYFITLPYAIWTGALLTKSMRGPLLPYVFRRIRSLFSL